MVVCASNVDRHHNGNETVNRGSINLLYWWLTQNTAVPTTKIIRNRMAQASTVLSGLRALVELLIASPLVGFIGDCTKTRRQ
jgi:hypothetical protein